MKREFPIDLIRVIAIYLIVQFHFCIAMGYDKTILYTTANGGWGSIGTGLFFMISGYVLIGNYEGKRNVFEFYKKRFLSIYPPYWMMFIIFYFIESYRQKSFTWGGKELWRLIFSLFAIDNYVGFFNIDSFYLIGEWFTTIILVLYLFYPMLEILMRTVARQVVTTIILTSICYLNMALDLWGFHPESTIFSGLLMFWFGMLMKRYISVLIEKKWIVYLCLVISVFLIFVELPYNKYKLPWRNTLVLCLFVVLFYIGKVGQNKLKDLYKNTILFFSSTSYCVYLSHHIIIRYVVNDCRDFLKNKIDVIVIYLAIWLIIVGISSVVWYGNRLLSRVKINSSNK